MKSPFKSNVALLTVVLLMLFLLQTACNSEKSETLQTPAPINNWEQRKATMPDSAALSYHSTYLPVYSEIYQYTEQRTYNLTVTVSIRNISSTDTLYLTQTHYYDTQGALIRNYFNHPVYVAPMETVEIVIAEKDRDGGTGGNFTFDWAIGINTPEPLFEAVMLSTTGQQGISFVTRGVSR